MTDVLIQADTLTLADDVRTALAALWPEARFHLDAQQPCDMVLRIGDQHAGDQHGNDEQRGHPRDHGVSILRVETPAAAVHGPADGVSIMQAPVRLQDVLHRLKDIAARPVIHRWGPYALDMARRIWSRPEGGDVDLTEKEAALLAYLGARFPQPASRDDLLRDVWNYAAGADTHTVETHLYRLRQKIERDPDHPAIVVNNGGGYIMGVLV